MLLPVIAGFVNVPSSGGGSSVSQLPAWTYTADGATAALFHTNDPAIYNTTTFEFGYDPAGSIVGIPVGSIILLTNASGVSYAFQTATASADEGGIWGVTVTTLAHTDYSLAGNWSGKYTVSFLSLVNLHSPGAIGDVVSGTVAATTLTNTQFGGPIRSNEIYWGGAESGLVPTGIDLGLNAGLLRWFDGHFYNGSVDVQLLRLAAGKLKVADATTGFGVLQAKLTTDTAATTGLVAGVLAGTTTSSLLLYDANGVAYDVPCTAH